MFPVLAATVILAMGGIVLGLRALHEKKLQAESLEPVWIPVLDDEDSFRDR
jgi:hypothetical protein